MTHKKRWWQKIFDRQGYNGKVLVIARLATKIFRSHHVSNQNLFLVTNHNKGNPSMTQDFPTSILMNATNASIWMLMWHLMQNRRIALVLITLLVVEDFWNGLKPKSTTWYSHFSSLNMMTIDGNKCVECRRMHCLTLLKNCVLTFWSKTQSIDYQYNRGPCAMCIVQACTWCKHVS
jgi:hypothetical protein